MFVTMDA
jgi:hypothetical protein